jgi:hypothetical protein
MKKTLLLASLILTCFVPLVVWADQGFGGVAENLLEPVGLASDFLGSACLILGGSFLFASIIKYVEHRRSPLMVPISTVIFLLVAGLVLILLPFLSALLGYGVPYDLMKSS